MQTGMNTKKNWEQRMAEGPKGAVESEGCERNRSYSGFRAQSYHLN